MLVTFDNAQAMREGWAVFNDGDIQRIDQPSSTGIKGLPDEPMLASDYAARELVMAKAFAGSVYHQNAIRFVLERAAINANERG